MNRAVDEQQVLFNCSPSNETVRPISRLTEKGVTSSGVSTEKAQKPPPLGSSNSTGTTTTAASSDRQQSVTFSTVTALPTAPVPAPFPEIPSLVSEKLNMDLFQWPRIYFSMAKEEDDDDEFIPLKNSGKLPPPSWPKMNPKSSNYLHVESTTTNGNGNHRSNRSSGSNKNHGICGNSAGGGDVLLQWGQNKRSRGSRSENGSSHARQAIKIQRRVTKGSEKLPSGQHLPQSTAGHIRGPNLRPCTSLLREVTTRNMDDLPTTLNGYTSSSNGRPLSRMADKRATPSQDKSMPSSSACSPLPTPANNGHHPPESSIPAAAADTGNAATTTLPEKVDMDLFEWPKIYISLSRKEKEDDFMAMKGTKLPQRPKRRAKIVDRNLQYCFPGMWLSDLSKGRYEVREKKCVKKKKRGLKGLESMDSGSE